MYEVDNSLLIVLLKIVWNLPLTFKVFVIHDVIDTDTKIPTE